MQAAYITGPSGSRKNSPAGHSRNSPSSRLVEAVPWSLGLRGNAGAGTGPSDPSPGRYAGGDTSNNDSTTRLPA